MARRSVDEVTWSVEVGGVGSRTQERDGIQDNDRGKRNIELHSAGQGPARIQGKLVRGI